MLELHAGIQNPNFNNTDNDSHRCKSFNEAAYEKAKSMAS
jgi:hypothetical protein